jgi:hypothetical protein
LPEGLFDFRAFHSYPLRERQRGNQVEVIRGTLNLTKNIYDAYTEAPYELKRQYLALFWEKILIQDKHNAKAVPTPLLQALLEEQKVIIRGNWLPDLDEFRTREWEQVIRSLSYLGLPQLVATAQNTTS